MALQVTASKFVDAEDSMHLLTSALQSHPLGTALQEFLTHSAEFLTLLRLMCSTNAPQLHRFVPGCLLIGGVDMVKANVTFLVDVMAIARRILRHRAEVQTFSIRTMLCGTLFNEYQPHSCSACKAQFLFDCGTIWVTVYVKRDILQCKPRKNCPV